LQSLHILATVVGAYAPSDAAGKEHNVPKASEILSWSNKKIEETTITCAGAYLP
jgi:hypothetical protein